MIGSGAGGAGSKRRETRRVTARSLERGALHYLSRYSTSTENLRRVLLRRVDRALAVHGGGREEPVRWVGDVISKLDRQGLLDDRAYAEATARRLVRRGKSERAIRVALAAKGVVPEVVDQGLAVVAREVNGIDLAAAVGYARRRGFGAFARARPLPVEKQLAALSRAGFPYAVATAVLAAATVAEAEALARPREPGS